MQDKQPIEKDFIGIFKWKFFIPLIYIASWVCAIIGPILFSKGYQIYCFVVIGYSIIKTLGMIFSGAYAIIRLKKIVRVTDDNISASTESQKNIDEATQIYHAIIIPSYKEDKELLKETLQHLASSQKSVQQFLIFLAMEDHEEGCQIKAESLKEQFKDQFRYIGFTRHKVEPHQAKGKASNVSFCVRHMFENLEGLMIQKEKVMLTIIDADSWAPKQYFDEIENQLKKKPTMKHRSIFCPPQIYTRNHLEAPVFNRIYDTMHTKVHLSSLVSLYFSFPLSNYSISYNLMEQIGFWDTNADAIGEDFHTCQKTCWKIQDRIYMTTIYTPFNQLSLTTGEGYCKDLKARFWQLERHTRGVSDVAYCLNMLFGKAKFQIRNIFLTVLVIEVFAAAAVIPWALLSLGIMYKIVPEDQGLQHFEMWIIDVLLNLTPALTIIAYFFYEGYRRIANRELYYKQNDPYWRMIEYPVLFVIALFGYSVPAFILSSFGVIFKKTQYRVAEKKVKQKQDNFQKFPDSSKNLETKAL